jgi:hypothetical protein
MNARMCKAGRVGEARRQGPKGKAGCQVDGYSTHANKEAGMLAKKTDAQARKVSKAGTQGKQEVTLGQIAKQAGSLRQGRADTVGSAGQAAWKTMQAGIARHKGMYARQERKEDR